MNGEREHYPADKRHKQPYPHNPRDKKPHDVVEYILRINAWTHSPCQRRKQRPRDKGNHNDCRNPHRPPRLTDSFLRYDRFLLSLVCLHLNRSPS
jgi:hypothetical protein